MTRRPASSFVLALLLGTAGLAGTAVAQSAAPSATTLPPVPEADVDPIEENGDVLGCAAVTIIWADLAEVRSLAVDEHAIGRGIGRQLVECRSETVKRSEGRALKDAANHGNSCLRHLCFKVSHLARADGGRHA